MSTKQQDQASQPESIREIARRIVREYYERDDNMVAIYQRDLTTMDKIFLRELRIEP